MLIFVPGYIEEVCALMGDYIRNYGFVYACWFDGYKYGFPGKKGYFVSDKQAKVISRMTTQSYALIYMKKNKEIVRKWVKIIKTQ